MFGPRNALHKDFGAGVSRERAFVSIEQMRQTFIVPTACWLNTAGRRTIGDEAIVIAQSVISSYVAAGLRPDGGSERQGPQCYCVVAFR